MSVPIAVFAFNRPERLADLLSSLERCPEIQSSQVTIYVDGPRDPSDRVKIGEVIEVAGANRNFEAKIITRSQNIGLRASITSGLSNEFEHSESVIVLEDDLVVSPVALRYFNEALKLYRDDEMVWGVTGYMYRVGDSYEREAAAFLPFPSPWGWATWKSKWQRFVDFPDDISKPLNSRSFRELFDCLGIRDFSSILKLNADDLVSSWFIDWYFAMFMHGGRFLWPGEPLISNRGMTSGTHAHAYSPHRFIKSSGDLSRVMPHLPSHSFVDYSRVDLIRASLDARMQKVVSRLGALKRNLQAK